MSTLAVTASRTETGNILSRKARAFFAEVRRAVEFVGQAYSHGVPPL